MPGTALLLEDEACQTVDVTAEAGLISQQAIKPTNVLAYHTHHRAHIDHGEERTDTYDIPLP